MVRKFVVIAGLALALMRPGRAFAGPVSPVDLDTLGMGSQIGSAFVEQLSTVFNTPGTAGTAETRVFFDGLSYLYTQTVTPTGMINFIFNTEFEVSGFTGVAGWDFGQAGQAGGNGNASDFGIVNMGGRLVWISMLGGTFFDWNAFEPITFFFVSTHPPAMGSYSLFSLFPIELGSAQGLAPSASALAPLPEPGSIALFGSGLVGLYTAMRRRRSLRM